MMNSTALVVFVALFAAVTCIGFFAARWRRGDLTMLHEWGLGGRRFGTIVTWFLIGGDLYTAYTFIAVPALMFGVGALGFFAVPYTIMIYPLLYLVFPRLWSVAHRHGYVTSADFVRGRFGNRWLALAVAFTGILATMPYIALQLVGIQVVIGAMGVETSGLGGDLPLIIAFVILAAFTYTSGLRAPAMIAVVKDVLIYVTVIAAIIAVTVLWFLAVKPGIESVARNAVISPSPVANTSNGGGGGKTSPPVNPTAGTTNPSGPGVDFAQRLAPGGPVVAYKVPSKTTLYVTDLVFNNPGSENGLVSFQRDSSDLLDENLANYRDLDYHFVTPIQINTNQTIRLAGSCKSCSLLVTGYETTS